MRILLSLMILAQLSACAATEAPAALRTRQEAACVAVIAAHIRRPSNEVVPRWLSEADGVAKVETWDNGRQHICDVDGSARVLGYSHPNA